MSSTPSGRKPAINWLETVDAQVAAICCTPPNDVDSELAEVYVAIATSFRECTRLIGAIPDLWKRPETYLTLAERLSSAVESARIAFFVVETRLLRAGGPNVALEVLNDCLTIRRNAPTEPQTVNTLNPILTRLYIGRDSFFSRVEERGILERLREQLARVPTKSSPVVTPTPPADMSSTACSTTMNESQICNISDIPPGPLTQPTADPSTLSVTLTVSPDNPTVDPSSNEKDKLSVVRAPWLPPRPPDNPSITLPDPNSTPLPLPTGRLDAADRVYVREHLQRCLDRVRSPRPQFEGDNRSVRDWCIEHGLPEGKSAGMGPEWAKNLSRLAIILQHKLGGWPAPADRYCPDDESAIVWELFERFPRIDTAMAERERAAWDRIQLPPNTQLVKDQARVLDILGHVLLYTLEGFVRFKTALRNLVESMICDPAQSTTPPPAASATPNTPTDTAPPPSSTEISEGGTPPTWKDLGEAKQAILQVLAVAAEAMQNTEVAPKAGYKPGTLRHHYGELQTLGLIESTREGYKIRSAGKAIIPRDNV